MASKLPDLAFHDAQLFNLPYQALRWEILKTAIQLQLKPMALLRS